MPDQNFNHEIFDSMSIEKAAAQSIASFLQDALFDEVNKMFVRHISEEDPDNPGGFIPSKNFMVSILQAIANDVQEPGGDVGDMSTQDLIQGLKFLPGSSAFVNEQDPYPYSSPRTTSILNELASRARESKSQADFIKAAFAEKRRADAEYLSSVSVELEAAPKVLHCGTALAIKGSTSARKRISSEARKKLRSCVKSPLDGRFVSREVHEYDYCVKSGQLERTLKEVERRTGDEGFDSATSNVAQWSYGKFVDAVKLRKLIAAIRKAFREGNSANVRKALGITPETQEAYENQILANMPESVFAGVLEEVEELFGM